MNPLHRWVRYGSLGVVLAAFVSTLSGCTLKQQLMALLTAILLSLPTGSAGEQGKILLGTNFSSSNFSCTGPNGVRVTCFTVIGNTEGNEEGELRPGLQFTLPSGITPHLLGFDTSGNSFGSGFRDPESVLFNLLAGPTDFVSVSLVTFDLDPTTLPNGEVAFAPASHTGIPVATVNVLAIGSMDLLFVEEVTFTGVTNGQLTPITIELKDPEQRIIAVAIFPQHTPLRGVYIDQISYAVDLTTLP